MLIDPTNLTPWPKTAGLDDTILDGDEDDGCIRFSREHGYAELEHAKPLLSRCVVVSSSDGRWDRYPPPRHWWEPLTLAEVDQLWQGYQRDWVERYYAQHVVADTAGHFVHRDEPDLVAHVVAAVIHAARAGEPVRLDPAGVTSRAGRLEPATS